MKSNQTSFRLVFCLWLMAYDFETENSRKSKTNRTKFEEIYTVIDLFRIQNSNVHFIIDMEINFSPLCFTLSNVYMIESTEYKWMINIFWYEPTNVSKTPDSWTLNTLLNFYAFYYLLLQYSKRFKDHEFVPLVIF